MSTLQGDYIALTNTLFKDHGEKLPEPSTETNLSLSGFLAWATELATSQPIELLRCILGTGHDLQYQLVYPVDPDYLDKMGRVCSPTTDRALVHYINQLCRARGVSSSRIYAQELLITESSDPDLAPLTTLPTPYLRLRFAFLQVVNTSVSHYLLPAVSLDTGRFHSLGSLLVRSRDILFYDIKLSFLHHVCNTTDRRSGDSVPPEIIFDPLTFVHQPDRSPDNTVTLLAKQQLARTPSQELCVKIASGGDPIFPFNVKLTGEVVQGTSGSFRYFMWLVAQELQSSVLPVLVECPSASAGENKGRYLLSPRNIDYDNEALLRFFGVLLGVAIRSDVPFAVDCLAPFWRCMLNEEAGGIRQSDIITFNFLRDLESLKCETEFKEMVVKTCSGHFSEEEECALGCPYRFTYSSLDGREVVLQAGSPRLTWSNLHHFIRAVRELRSCEVEAANLIPIIQSGLASVVPLEPLKLLGPTDLELRICGQQHVDISFIKLHTIYQVGITASDKHIEYFWNVVESLSQEDLRKLIKFACNQERIPFTCPCQVRVVF